MRQQGERRGTGEDDWWSELYGGRPRDTGPGGAEDSVDDRFDSAARAVGAPARQRPEPAPAHADRRLSAGDRRQQTAEEGEWWVGGPVSALPQDPAAGPAPEQWPEPNWLPRQVGPEGFVQPGPAADAVGDDLLQAADPGRIGELVPDTVLDGGRHGALTLRAVSRRGEDARRRGEPRGEALLTARFGAGDQALLLIATAAPAAAAGAAGSSAASSAGHRSAAQEACRRIAEAVGRNRAALVQDLATGRYGEAKAGLHRLSERMWRERTAHLSPAEEVRPAGPLPDLGCLLVPADPRCTARVFFGTGGSALFRLRAGTWDELTPDGPAEREDPGGPHTFVFHVCLARPGDVLLLCGRALAAPMRDEPAAAGELARRWAGGLPRDPAAFLDDVRSPAAEYPGDRTAAALWEA